MDSVLIVILNWNGLDDTEKCLKSLKKQTYSNFKIALVDNGSIEPGTDDRLNKIQRTYGDLIYILRNQKNLGFDGGVNTGIRFALEKKFDYIALLNNDAVAAPDWLSILVKTSNQKGSHLTTGLLLHEDGKTIDSTADLYTTWGLPFPRLRNEPTCKAPPAGFVFGVSGGASLYKTSLFESIGLFDETFFAYYEDVDISFRALLAGFTSYYEPTAVAYHKQGATSSKIPGFAVMQTMKNLPLLYIKNVPTKMLIPIGFRFLFAYLLIFGNALISRNFFPTLKGFILGVWYFWTDALPKRFKIQTNKRVSDQTVRALLINDLPPDQTGLRKLFRRPVQ